MSCRISGQLNFVERKKGIKMLGKGNASDVISSLQSQIESGIEMVSDKTKAVLYNFDAAHFDRELKKVQEQVKTLTADLASSANKVDPKPRSNSYPLIASAVGVGLFVLKMVLEHRSAKSALN